jgi:hypothetical protein
MSAAVLAAMLAAARTQVHNHPLHVGVLVPYMF